MKIDLEALNKIPLIDVLYLCLREESHEHYTGNAELPSGNDDFDSSGITRNIANGDYGLKHVGSALSLCETSGESEYTEWLVFNREDSFVAVEINYPDYSDDETDGSISSLSDELDRTGMEEFVIGHLREKASQLTKSLENVNACIDKGGSELVGDLPDETA